MALDPSIIAAAANGIGQAVNWFQTNKTNKDQRKWMEGMYDRQRQDALADWQMQADYNSPAAQMKRLKDANLNPNLVYGNGVEATMGAAPRASSTGSYNPTAPQIDANTPFMAAYDIKMKDAQIDNLQVAKAVAQQDVLLKAAQTQSTLQDAHTKDFDLKMKNDLKSINVDMAQKALDKARADTDSAWSQAGILQNQHQISDATIKENIDKTKAEAAKALNEADASKWMETRVMQEIDNLKSDGDLKKFQVNLNRLGITPGDNVFLRIFTTLFGKYVPKP